MLTHLGLAGWTANRFGVIKRIDMININGLTQEQVDMLDIIWAFDTKEEYNDWFENLDYEEYMMCRGLMELLTLAILDEALDNRSHGPDRFKEANQVINQVKSNLTQNK
jgi:hypothetical protein